MSTLPFPHRKQRDFMKSQRRFKLLLWGRRCFAPDTLVNTPDGYREIKDLRPGDMVYSLYEGTIQPKEVLVNRYYGAMNYPKAMLKLVIDGREITTTYDHEFYYKGEYVPVYLLAWGKMAPSQREELKLLCEQYGAFTDNEIQRWAEDPSNETSIGQEGLPEDGDRREDRKDSQSCSGGLAQQPLREGGGESPEWEEGRQSDNKPGVGNSSGEYKTRSSKRSGISEPWGEVRHSQAEGASSSGDIKVPEGASRNEYPGSSEDTISEVPNKGGLYQGYTSWEEIGRAHV